MACSGLDGTEFFKGKKVTHVSDRAPGFAQKELALVQDQPSIPLTETRNYAVWFV